MTASVTALSGVNWTDLNGAGLNAAQEAALVTSITGASSVITALDQYFQKIPAHWSVSIDDMSTTFASEADARTHLAAIQNPGNIGVYSKYFKSDGTIGYLVTYQNAYNVRETYKLEDRTSSYTINNGRLEVDFSGLGMPVSVEGSVPTITYSNTLLDSALTRLGFTRTTALNAHQRELVQRAFKEQSYIEASKLSVISGGGIKTYNGSWYVNGEKVSYLEITLAVRVNQLYVINEAITEQLKQVQQNNKKIKFANTISSIIANKTPANSSGTQNIDEVAALILMEGIKEGLIPVHASHTEALEYLRRPIRANQNIFTFYRDEGGRVRMLMRNHDAGRLENEQRRIDAGTWNLDVTNMTATEMVNTMKAYTGSIDLTALKTYFPNSFSKLFNANSIKTSGTLTQTECTTMTTELKSIITGIDSNNQVLQTQLSQYNDKRTEVLDSMSSIIKGHNGSMAGIGRNLSAT